MMNLNEHLQSAKLDFKVLPKPIYLQGDNTIDDIPIRGRLIDTHHATVREDTRDVLGIVGSRYQIIQNTEALGIADFLDGDFKSARAVDNGRIVSVAIDIGSFRIAGDDLNKRVFLRTSHDGSCAVEARMQVFRLICSNGLMGWRNRAVVKIRHTESYRSKIDEARRVLGIADEYYKQLDGAFNKMVETPLTAAERETFLDTLIGKPDDKKKRDCITPIRERITTALYGDDLTAHRGNAWGMYNAVAAYVDHTRGENSNDDRQYAMRNWGTGFDMKNRAFELLTV